MHPAAPRTCTQNPHTCAQEFSHTCIQFRTRIKIIHSAMDLIDFPIVLRIVLPMLPRLCCQHRLVNTVLSTLCCQHRVVNTVLSKPSWQIALRSFLLHFWSVREMALRPFLLHFWSIRQMALRPFVLDFWSIRQIALRPFLLHLWSPRQIALDFCRCSSCFEC